MIFWIAALLIAVLAGIGFGAWLNGYTWRHRRAKAEDWHATTVRAHEARRWLAEFKESRLALAWVLQEPEVMRDHWNIHDLRAEMRKGHQ